jgi:eukaryotic-like serine/threonine-protein kinase
MARGIPTATTRPIRPNLPGLPDRYRDVRHVATGGMASVVAAEDQVLGRTVAVKVLAAHLAEDPRMVQRFEREARTAASLSGHPHVVTIYDIGEHEGRPYIVMEYLPGGTVAMVLLDGMPATEEVLRWLGQSADALDAAHERGIVHRDVKPANLLLDARRDLAVADFGIARLVESETITAADEVLGTAAYISPEQAMGEEVTPASDRYSLAVVAFELLTGERPFRGEAFTAQARAHIDDPPPRPSGQNPELPPTVDAVLLKGLSKDPDRRYETATALSEALQDAVRSDPTRTAVGMSAARPRTALAPRSRRRGWLGRGLGALAALGLVYVLVSALGGKDDAPDQQATPPTGQATRPAARPPTGAVSDGAALNDQGFALMRRGRYEEAIPVLRRAVAAFPAGTDDLTYAYALYNLGRSLRLAGQPEEAIPVLRRRLRIPNQREIVARELALAMRDAGLNPGSSPPADASPGKGGGKKRGKKGD